MTTYPPASALERPTFIDNLAAGLVSVTWRGDEDIAPSEWQVAVDEIERSATRLEATGALSFTDTLGELVELPMSHSFDAAVVRSMRLHADDVRRHHGGWGGAA